MTETTKVPRSMPNETIISPQLLKGDIRLNELMIIKGEGDERKLFVSVGLNEKGPIGQMYEMYVEGIKSIIKDIEQARLSDDKKAIDEALNDLNAFKSKITKGIVAYRMLEYTNTNDDFLVREKGIVQDHTNESIRQRQKLAAEVSEVFDKQKYMQHLVSKGKFEVVFPEQKPN